MLRLHRQEFLLELLVVVADAPETRGPESACHFGADSAHRNLCHLSLGQAELLPDFLLVAAERGEESNVLDVSSGKYSDPSSSGLLRLRLTPSRGLSPPVRGLAARQVPTKISEVPR